MKKKKDVTPTGSCRDPVGETQAPGSSNCRCLMAQECSQQIMRRLVDAFPEIPGFEAQLACAYFVYELYAMSPLLLGLICGAFLMRLLMKIVDALQGSQGFQQS